MDELSRDEAKAREALDATLDRLVDSAQKGLRAAAAARARGCGASAAASAAAAGDLHSCGQ